MNQQLKEKIHESLSSVIPITAIVLVLGFILVPIPTGTLGLFLIGAMMLIVGMGLFTWGVELSLMPMGSHIGAYLTKSRNLKLIISIVFLMGIFITMAEPDLTVLANQIPNIPNAVLIGAVALGVGFFLVVAIIRIIFQKKLSYVLMIFYAAVFAFAIFASEEYIPVAFDSGGVTTGPITVPFIMALGIGIASVHSGGSGQDDSFGLIAMGSLGPILAVMILGMFFPSSAQETIFNLVNPADTLDVMHLFLKSLPHYMLEVGIALAPILITFLIFQIVFLRLPLKQVARMFVGLFYTYAGLVVFLTGVNVGFMPAGYFLGNRIGASSFSWLLVPIGMVMGYFIVSAEPAVHVLNAQVEELTGGAISRRAMMLSLSIGVACSIGLAMIRVITGISIWWFLIPGYIAALGLMFFVPNIFTGLAFDSGGVASGAMTATFTLPFAMGACRAVGGNMMTDAFGVVAMVAMMPLITIQALGLIYKLTTLNKESVSVDDTAVEIIDNDEEPAESPAYTDDLPDFTTQIIEEDEVPAAESEEEIIVDLD